MDCRFEFFNITNYDYSSTSVNHKHRCYELIYIYKGSGYFIIDNKVNKYLSGQFLIIPPNILHEGKMDENTEYMSIGFSCDSNLLCTKNEIYNDNKDSTILNVLLLIKLELSEKNDNFQSKIDLLINILIIDVSRIINKIIIKSHDFSSIIKYIDEHYTEKLDLHSLSSSSGYSYHHFRHLFKERFGFSPINYIINKQLDSAISLLMQGDIPINLIALRCGFSNAPQFYQMFKRFYGITPNEYRISKLVK